MSVGSSSGERNALSASLLTGRSLVLLQLVTRLLTFTLNQSLVRIASPEVFGTAAIQFDLVSDTIRFLSREGIRNALLRAEKADQGKDRQVRALSVVPFQSGLVVAALVCGVYLLTSSRSTTAQPTFHLSLALYVVSALLELAVEPLYLRALRSSPPRISVRVQAEGGMAIVKAVVTVASLVVLEGQGGGRALLGFALGQLAGASWLAGRYLVEYGDARDLLWISKPRGYVTLSFLGKTLLIEL